MIKEKIVFIGDYNFPSDMAACSRVYYMARAFQLAGFDTLVIGKGKLTGEGRDICEYKGVSYTTMRRSESKAFTKIIRYRAGRRVYTDALIEYASDAKYIIPYACSCPSHMKGILKFGKEKNIKVVCDVSEWYSFRQFSGIAGKIDYFIFQYAFRNVFYKCDKIICSSSLISSHFLKKNQNVLILNGIMDVSEYQPKFDLSNERCIMVYAGSPGRKDYLIQFLRAFELTDDSIKQKINLKIIGLTDRDVSRLHKKTQSSRYGQIELMPRMPREKLIDILKNANYSLLLRPNLRYANAGFPSKLCESAALGTPMITNLTSDMDKYLSEKNAIIIKDISPGNVAEAMKEAANMDERSYLRLRHGAYDIAENYFDISVCSKKLKEFLGRN